MHLNNQKLIKVYQLTSIQSRGNRTAFSLCSPTVCVTDNKNHMSHIFDNDDEQEKYVKVEPTVEFYPEIGFLSAPPTLCLCPF